MQATKFKSLFSLAAIYKNCVRTVAVTSTTTNTNTENLKPFKDIPGPPSLPIIGQLHHFMFGGVFTNMEDPKTVTRLTETYGPIIRLDSIFGKPPLLFLSDPESVAFILRSENWMPIRPDLESLEYYRKYYKKNKKAGQGNKFQTTGLSTENGKEWKEFRSTVNPVMLQPKTIKLYTAVIDEVAQDMIARMKANRDDNNMIKKDFYKEMNLWALESIGTVALGCRLNCFDPNLPPESPEWQLFQCIQDLFTISYEIDFKPNLWRLFPTPMFWKAMKLYEKHENLLKYFIKKGQDNLKNKCGIERGVLEKLLEINEYTAYIMASDMLFAGVDTAANTVTATLYLLAKNPEKQAKLREEILSKSERRPYLRACIKESMRLMPVVAGNARKTSKPYNILGYEVPKDVNIIFTHQTMSLMENNFPRADEFIPERWLVKKDDPLYYGHSHPFACLPFGFGVRSCIGRRIAELEMETFMSKLMENFQVEWFGPPPKTVHRSLNYIMGPYNFVFRDIK
ncbi:hypothetical protein PYW07_015821 [Mythimna separata]|uniref:Cytochrome P450 n=1 Tax=Mythimna separata TaxID=271217 RepID=A0AAD7YQ15_MYTSE|nr:hypothetical protein PYW07_015821 [Mythimna separata]